MTILEYYRNTYDSLIEKRRKFPLTKNKKDPNYVYCETHHIVPKCLGGSNDKENLVNLTAREHFIAHKLLYKIAEKENADIDIKYKLFLALRYLAFSTKNNKIVISSREYEQIKIIASMLSSKTQQNFSIEKKNEIAIKKKNTLAKHNMYEFRSIWSSNHGWIKNPITHESKYIQKEEFDNYISNGWLPGFYKGKHKHPRNVTVFWICNDETKESKWWKKTEPIPDGWRKGRYIEIKNKRKTPPGNKGLKWIHKDGVRKYINSFETEKYLSDGWQLGIGK